MCMGTIFVHSPGNPTAHSQPTFHSLPEGSAFSFSSLTHNDGHWPRSLTTERARKGKMPQAAGIMPLGPLASRATAQRRQSVTSVSSEQTFTGIPPRHWRFCFRQLQESKYGHKTSPVNSLVLQWMGKLCWRYPITLPRITGLLAQKHGLLERQMPPISAVWGEAFWGSARAQ